MGFSRQKYWSALPFPSPGDLPNPGIEPRSPTLQADTLLSEPLGKMQSLGSLIVVIPLRCASAIRGQYPVFPRPEFPQSAESGMTAAVDSWMADILCFRSEFPQDSPSRWLSCDG